MKRRGFKWSATNGDIAADTLHLRDVALATIFWLSVGHKYGCVIASGTIFDSRGRFLESSYLMQTYRVADLAVLRDIAIATDFGCYKLTVFV